MQVQLAQEREAETTRCHRSLELREVEQEVQALIQSCTEECPRLSRQMALQMNEIEEKCKEIENREAQNDMEKKKLEDEKKMLALQMNEIEEKRKEIENREAQNDMENKKLEDEKKMVLNIPTKINEGTVEIITPVEVIKQGEEVGYSEASLLVKIVYDNGSIYDPALLDLTEVDLIGKFSAGISNVAGLSLALNYPTLAAAPRAFINAYKNVLAVAIATKNSFHKQRMLRSILRMQDPSKFPVAATPVDIEVAAPSASASKEEENKPEPEEESDYDMGFSLFD